MDRKSDMVTFSIKRRTYKTIKTVLIIIASIMMVIPLYSIISNPTGFDVYAYVRPEIDDQQGYVDELLTTLKSNGIIAKQSRDGQVTVDSKETSAIMVHQISMKRALKSDLKLDDSVWNINHAGKCTPFVEFMRLFE